MGTEISKAFVLVGPTAVGKTAVAQVLALRRKLPVLSADSMLVYKGMDIGTAKPSAAERGEVRYFGLDLVEPSHEFTVHDFIASVPSVPELIVAGGTGLYIKCLLQGLDDVAPPNLELRERVESWTVELLQEELRQKAPALLDALSDKENPRRLIRALERAEAGLASRTWSENCGTIVGLRMPQTRLALRIEERVQAMYTNGLLEEAKKLRADGALSKTALQAIGYAEAFDVLDGKMTEKAAQERTAIRTRQLAKRQMTWFRNQADVDWVDVEAGMNVETVADMVEFRWQQHGPSDLRIKTA